MLRRLKGDTSHTEHLPIGILPLGRTNNVARRLLKPDDDNQVHFLAHAAMTIIKETSSAQPVVKIENLQVYCYYFRICYTVIKLCEMKIFDPNFPLYCLDSESRKMCLCLE